MTEKRPTIGLMMSGLENDYTSAVRHGIATAAEDFDCNLVIFAGRYIDHPIDDASGELIAKNLNTVYSYASEHNLDFLIIPFGALCVNFDKKIMDEFIHSFGNIPIISLAIEVDGCSCVRYDCRPGLTALINHIIDVHSCRKIAFLAGRKEQADSEERLQVYRDVLEDKGIPYDPRLVIHCNLSENSVDTIEAFLQSLNYDLDAICCGNDSSAQAVYKVLEKKGLVPGKDIIVTGYDNLPFSAACSPSLSTVSASAHESAYRAVQMGVECLRSGKPFYSIELPTRAVFRESSCGSSCYTESVISLDPELVSKLDDLISKWLTSEEHAQPRQLMGIVNRQFRSFLELLISEINNPEVTELSIDKLVALFCDYSESVSFETNSGSLCDLLTLTECVVFKHITDPDKKMQLCTLFVLLYRIAVNAVESASYRLLHSMRRTLDFTNNMSGHVSTYGKDIHLALIAIVEYLSKLGIDGCYIYLDEDPAPITSLRDIKPFEELKLTAYEKTGQFVSLLDNPPAISRYDIIKNDYIDFSTRKTMMVSPLFSSREQYGVLVCDVNYQHLALFQAISSQINSTIETVFLLTRLNRQLNETETKNVILSNIAARDALTGCYNRLGFFEHAGSSIVSPQNRGRKGFALFADVNNLKKINDSYGHDEGDHALCAAVKAFVNSFDDTAIIGRFGGDEFVIIWITSDKRVTCDSVRRRVKQSLKKIDSESGYPYHVGASIGVYGFTCNEHLSIQEIIDRADRLQYIDKAHKSKDIFKK